MSTERRDTSEQDFSLSHTVSPNFRTLDFHAHDAYEILYFLKGEVQYYIEDKSYYLVPGDILIIPPSTLHRPVIIDENITYDRLVLLLSVDYCQKLMKRAPECFVWKDIDCYRIPAGEKGYENFEQTLRNMLSLSRDSAGLLERDSYVTLLLLQFHRFIQSTPSVADAPDMRMQQVIRYINGHFTENLSLNAIADRFYLSKFHLLRQFKTYTNSTVHNYILAKRVLLSKTLLKQGMSPSEVSTACGFGSYAGFYQAFVQSMGISPSQFMKIERE